MATIDLGKIKLVWRGTYASGTAYTVDDVVQHTDGGITSSFICTTNSTGNAPSTGGSVHGSWAYLAKGSGDATLTTQGDILYYGGSGLARLGAGTSGQVLQTGGSGANPSWTTMSSDVVKVGSGTFSGSTSQVDIDGYFSSTYRIYKLFISNLRPVNNAVTPRWRIKHGGSTVSSSIYRHFHDHWYGTTSSGSENIHSSGSYPDSYFNLAGTNNTANTVNDGTPTSCEMVIFNPLNTTEGKTFLWQSHTHESGGSHAGQLNGWHGVGSVDDTTALSGLTVFFTSGNVKTMNWQLYGFKH